MTADLRYAFRSLFKAPGFTVIAVLTLALGIGANSAIFSVIDSVLLRPLPFPQPDRLVAVWSKIDSGKETESFPDFQDFREQAQSFASLTTFVQAGAVLGQGQEVRELSGIGTTSDAFAVFGVQPFLGRGFNRTEDAPDSHVIVLTNELWKKAFNSDPNIIGREIFLSLKPYTVIGVMPPGFRYPIGEPLDYLMPLHPLVAKELPTRGSHFLRIVGRLKPGATAAGANAEIRAIAQRQAQQYPDTNKGRSAFVIGLHDDVVGNVRPALFVILTAVFFVLLIACANVANLLLARATARRREIAIRTALGAGRRDLIRQLLLEGFVLALLGGGMGLLLAWWGTDLLRAFGPQDVPRLDEVKINGAVVCFAFGAAVVSTLLFALVPALQISRANVSEALQEGSRGAVGPESHRVRSLLIIAQVALSILLLTGAGLLIRSFAKLSATNPGFDPSRVVTADIALPRVRYSEPEKQQQFFDRLLAKLSALPGIEAAGAASPLAFTGNDSANSFWISERPDPGPGNHPDASNLTVAGEYFRTMRIPLLRGRFFETRDQKEASPAVLINETFARKFFPNRNPLGQHLQIDSATGKPDIREIVGVVGSTRHETLRAAPLPEFYLPATQAPARRMDIVLRTSAESLFGLDQMVRSAAHELDPDVYLPRLRSMRELIGGTLAQPRFNMILLGTFASVAMVLALIGIYGVIAYSVAQRTREIGIRMALGGQRVDMLTMIVRQSFTVVAVGLVAGLVGAFATTRLLQSLLYEVSAFDLPTFALVVLALSLAALLASFFPARRAMRVDPIVALRHD